MPKKKKKKKKKDPKGLFFLKSESISSQQP